MVLLFPLCFTYFIQPTPLAKYASCLIPLFLIGVIGDCLNLHLSSQVSAMGNCLSLSPSAKVLSISKKNKAPLPVDNIFKLPSPLPTWPPGNGFASGIINLGGLQVRQISSFNKVWATKEGGPDNLGATFFEPSNVPQGFFMLGSYSQANNQTFFGRVLVAKDDSGGALKKPLDYTLVWSSESSKIKQDGNGYIWLPTPPDGYKAVGHVVTSSPNKPSPDQIRCVRSDLTDQCEAHTWTWGPGKDKDDNGFNVYIDWFFGNGALLYKKGEESKPTPIEPTGSNLPQGGSNDGAYWLDLPVDEGAKERVKKGDLGNSQVYVHIKPMLGATFTDMAIWVFYPFNGPAKAKVEMVNVPLGKIGEHVGDWEHVTLRVSNFNGELQRVYFSEHSGGTWVDAPELDFQNGNKPMAYASLNGHAFYSKPGLVLQGSKGIGIRNDSEKSNLAMDTGLNYSVVSAEYLGSAVVEPPWLNYCREWGPKLSYDLAEEIKKVEKLLPGPLKSAFDKFIKGLPSEVLGEEGPTGPKMKNSWTGDEPTPLAKYASCLIPLFLIGVIGDCLNLHLSSQVSAMGNCLSLSPSAKVLSISKKNKAPLPVDNIFKLPSPLPTWPPVWATKEGGPDNLGATFFEPSNVPQGFFMLGSYSQANNQTFFGRVLVAKDDSGGALKKPLDYTLVWSSESSKIKQDGNGYIWLPTPPDGYKAVGHVVTSSPNKPSPDQIRCVRSDLTNQCEAHTWTWGPGKDKDDNGFNVYIDWFFGNGALLYKKGEESKPTPIEPTGSNLPQGGSNDGAYWLDLPVDEGAKEGVKKGDLGNSQVYVHIKPMLGATFTDMAIWVFYPFNGPAKAKVEMVNVPLGKIGEHVGDWEHVTLRVSNFNGELQRVYFSEHSGGTWVDAPELEFQNGNKPMAYASLNGHAFYSKPGLVLQGSKGIGIRNDSEKSNLVMDTGLNYSVVSADYLGSAVVEPPWLNYCREWGPKLSYDLAEEIKKVGKLLPGPLKSAFDKFIKGLPSEVLGEEGPTGPKMKNSWTGDEV
ncbi:hypothetical protein CFP56_034175 [Quercus suber]|uniref:Vacuolar protein sorting-associated protein 62 n=1 Tax=Quercus suber TaxID=58331 RepID=A0AAW0LRP0_QUESU